MSPRDCTIVADHLRLSHSTSLAPSPAPLAPRPPASHFLRPLSLSPSLCSTHLLQSLHVAELSLFALPESVELALRSHNRVVLAARELRRDGQLNRILHGGGTGGRSTEGEGEGEEGGPSGTLAQWHGGGRDGWGRPGAEG